jgi:hypothetical protein
LFHFLTRVELTVGSLFVGAYRRNLAGTMTSPNEELRNLLTERLAERGGFSPQTTEAMVGLMFGVLAQIASDVARATETQPRATCDDVIAVLTNRGFRQLGKQLALWFPDHLAEEKIKKIQRLRDLGYGATSDHVSFIKHIFESQHQGFLPALEGGEPSSDDEPLMD